MTETERKALAMVNEVNFERGYAPYGTFSRALNQRYEALCRAIEQREAFREEVSDAVGRAIDDCGHDGMRKAHISSRLDRFIIGKPDPLVEAMSEAMRGTPGEDYREPAEALRQALAARGLKIVEVE